MADWSGHIADAALHSVNAKIRMLQALAPVVQSLQFSFALSMILAAGGKCVVCGIGKSGHIGRKIVATMQSTGQRAAFLHPAEAAHGDMGLIQPSDIILLLSNSGETDELDLVISRARDLRCNMIMITSQPGARMSRRVSDLNGQLIVTPDGLEGDPIGRAPMASTVAQLAIGDALCSALMESRGFTAEDFTALHHGGYLGRAARAVA